MILLVDDGIKLLKIFKEVHKCQIYADKIHVPHTLLNVISSAWPFSMWGIDMIGMIETKASNEHHFIFCRN